MLTKEEIQALLAQYDRFQAGKDSMTLSAVTTGNLARTALAALARAEDAEAAAALVVERAAALVNAPDISETRDALLSLPAVYAHQINTGVREVYDPLQRFYRMEDVLQALIPKRTADDRA